MRPTLFRLLLAGAAALLALTASAEGRDKLNLAELKGKVVYLDFWASWCGPCRESFPWMQSMQRRFGKRGLVVIAVNLDQERQLADTFLQEHRHDFKIVFDPEGQLAERYNVTGMPSSILIDRQGKIRQQHIGFKRSQSDELRRQVESLLAEHVAGNMP